MKGPFESKGRGTALPALSGFLFRTFAVPRIVGALSGQVADLSRLLPLARFSSGSPALAAFLRGLSRDIETGSGVAQLLARIGRSANRRAKRKLIENLIYHWGVRGAQRRARIMEGDICVPSFVVISPTMRCNLRCTGCYSGLYSRQEELAEADLDRLLAELRDLGVFFVVISGGEPYLLRETLLRLFRKYNDMYFLTYTNGTLLDEETVSALGRLGNVAPAISVEGYGLHTDRRRGVGVYADIMRAMALLRREGVIFGISVTYTRENLEIVTNPQFIRSFISQGALFGWYFMFMPVGRDPCLELVPTPEQRVACGKRIAQLRRSLPIFLADFWNDGPAVGGCLAAGRSYLHILNTGKVEPCVFSHFGVDTIHEKSLLAAVNSPFFRSIRARFPYNENGNLKRPCMIIDNPEVLREAVAEHLVEEGHPSSEAILRDPDLVAWIDRYAARMRELTDPEWEEQIAEPADRWYRGGSEYGALFARGAVARPGDRRRNHSGVAVG